VALLVIVAAYLPRIVALFPLTNDVTESTSAGEDWLPYHERAIDVLQEGPAMPVVGGPYQRPAGFGYVYFVALVYSLFGARSEAVYLVQGLLLIGTIGGMYAVFRTRLTPRAGLVLLWTLVLFMWLDMYRYYTFRLLSENLLIALWPPFLFLMLRGESTGRTGYFAAAGAICGLCFLVRPNLLGLAPATAAVMLLYPRDRKWRRRDAVVLLSMCAAVSSLLLVRNYVATGVMSPIAFARPEGWQTPDYSDPASLHQRVMATASFYASRTAFTLGIPEFMNPDYRLRPHWLVMWAAFVWYALRLMHRKPAFWEVLLLVLLLAYLIPLIAVADISSYGFRMISPAIPLALVLVTKGMEPLLGESRP